MGAADDPFLSSIFAESMWDLLDANPDMDTLNVALQHFAERLRGANPIRRGLARRELTKRLEALGVLDPEELAGATVGMSASPVGFGFTGRRNFVFLDDEQIAAQHTPDDLIAGILPARSLTLLYGPPAVGKTFLALDLSFAITRGIPWCGHTSKRGQVLYVIAEGQSGIGKRIRAWKSDHGIPKGVVGLLFLPEPLNLLDSQTAEAFIDAARPSTPVLVVIDTLARNMVGGDEDSAKDMGRFVANLDRIRLELNCAILLVHHPTKSKPQVERGSSALRGAADMVIFATRLDNTVTLVCGKSKDADPFDSIGLKLKEVTLPDGETSCVFAHTGSASPRDEMIGEALKRTLRLLADVLASRGATAVTTRDLMTAAAAIDVPRRTVYGHLHTLVTDEYIARCKRGSYKLTNKGIALGMPPASELQSHGNSTSPTTTAASATPPVGGAVAARRSDNSHSDTGSSVGQEVSTASGRKARFASFATEDLRDEEDEP